MKKTQMSMIQIPLDHLCAVHEYDCEIAFLALIRRCCRIRGAVKAQGFEELIADGIVVVDGDGLIPACVAETIAYVEERSRSGTKGMKNRYKSLEQVTELELCNNNAKQSNNQSKAKQSNSSEAKASSLSASPTAGEAAPQTAASLPSEKPVTKIKKPKAVLDDAKIAEIQSLPTYSRLDVHAEFDKCRLWYEAKNRPEPSYSAFLNWLNGSVDKLARVSPATSKPTDFAAGWGKRR